MRPWLWLCLVLLLLHVAPTLYADAPTEAEQDDGAVVAQPPPDNAAMLAMQARLARLRDATKREASVRTAVEQADLALARARMARTRADEAFALRAEQVAEAATSLAERRLARVREGEATRGALARRDDAKAFAKAARESLAVAHQHAAEAP